MRSEPRPVTQRSDTGTLTQDFNRFDQQKFEWSNIHREFFRALRKWPVIPGFVLILLLIAGTLTSVVAPRDPNYQTLGDRHSPPVWESSWYQENDSKLGPYVLGADHLGRDVLSRVVHGARISLLVISVALTAGIIVGTFLGLLAGYMGGLVDEVIMRIWDIWAGIPFLLFAMVVATIVGNGLWVMMGILAIGAWAPFVRNVRAEAMMLRDRDYVLIAQISGASTLRVLLRHILPNLINTVVVIATLRVGNLILAEASLSYLGIGIPKNIPTWGNMIADGRGYVDTSWWITMFPGLALLLVIMSFNFLGDWLRDRWDPRLKNLTENKSQ